MHEGGASAQQVSEVTAEEHDRAGEEHHDDCPEAECCIELLPRIELSDGDGTEPARATAQPLPVRWLESVQARGVVAECA